MYKKQFEMVITLLQQIADNTKPSSRVRRIFETIGLVVTIASVLSGIDIVVNWFRR